jgi:DNA excision repair protein ERCC-4
MSIEPTFKESLNMNNDRSQHTDNASISSDSDPIVPKGMLPEYLAEAFGELYAEDGLLVLGKGLGCLQLLASFVRFYADTKEGHLACLAEEQDDTDETSKKKATNSKGTPKPPLLLVLGLRDAERSSLVAILESWGTPPELLPTMITNESGQGKDREILYRRGGVFCITSRILIVDLLTNIASADCIDGILVAHAEQVTEQSMEAFILRIFQGQKQPFGSGFVKAFTDAPDQLNSGFAKPDKVLKALHVRRLYLYPRFRDSVRRELERHPPAVTEFHQGLSPLQKEIQNAIAAAVQSCIRELKASTTMITWNDTELSVENCVTTNFDRTISRQLEHDWHRLKPQTKQLVQDLRTLRTLFQSLIQYDCISFWKLINSIRTMSAASRNPSMWLLTPAADMLFRKAKERVYKIVRQRPTEQVPQPVAVLKPVLEENLKWKLLRKVLAEIREEHEKKQDCVDRDDWQGPTNVLVMAKDQKSVEAIQSYLVDGKEKTLTLRWLRYLEQHNDRSRSMTENKGGTSGISEESRLLLEEEGRARRLLFGTSSKAKGKSTTKSAMEKDGKRKKLNEVPDYMKKRRRIAKEKGRGELTHQTDDLEREAVLGEALESTERDMNNTEYTENTFDPDDAGNDWDDEDTWFRTSFPQELRVVVKNYSGVEGDDAGLLLQDIQPAYVVFYDADASFVRSVEMYNSLKEESDPIKVFFLMFEASAEEKNFVKSLEREQDSFERLIHHKKTMPTPVSQSLRSTQEMQQAYEQGSVVSTYMEGSLPLSMDTRTGRGATDTRTGRGKLNTTKERRDIAVDVREFRSSLPSILHQGGMRLAPVTLIVGDFVLSNVHCVERKSISDLFGSFASGRLFTQAEAMRKHYKCPCLLIEFDEAKSFCLQNSKELGVDIRTDSVCSKMALLAMHFPELRIIWSRSPHETLRIFRELKTNHDEVDVEKAVQIGRDDTADALLRPNGESEEDDVNETARDMLLRLPGVNVHSARKIMQECDSLAEFSKLSREEMRRIAGPVTGQKLFTFFRQKIAAT